VPALSSIPERGAPPPGGRSDVVPADVNVRRGRCRCARTPSGTGNGGVGAAPLDSSGDQWLHGREAERVRGIVDSGYATCVAGADEECEPRT
jgi:hypothetical protein